MGFWFYLFVSSLFIVGWINATKSCNWGRLWKTKHVSKFSTFSQFSQFHEVAFGKSRIRHFLENLYFYVFPVTRLHSKRLIREIHLYLRKCKKYISIFVRNTFLYLSEIDFYIWRKSRFRHFCCHKATMLHLEESQIREIGDEN